MSIFAQSMSSNDSVLGLLNMMSDPDAFKEKLKQLTALQQDLDEKIALAGDAAEIVNIKKSVQEQHAKALEVLKSAEEKSQLLIDNATARANSLVAEAEKSAKSIIEDATDTKNSILEEAARLKDANHTICADRLAAVEEKEREHLVNQKLLEDERRNLELDIEDLTLKDEKLEKELLDISHQKNVLSSELSQVREGKARIIELLADFKDELDYLVFK